MSATSPGTAFVTGGGSGIGGAICAALGRDGYHLAVADIDVEAAERTAAGVREAGGAAEACQLDVSDPDAWAAVLDPFAGRLRVLVNNAGLCIGVPLPQMSLAQWRRQNGVNLDGVFFGMRQAIPLLAETGGGAIVNIASVAGIRGIPSLAGYCATKAGIIALSKAAAMECAGVGNGIRINAVLPGGIETPLWSKIDHDGSVPESHLEREEALARHRAGAAAATPLGHAGTPEDVAEMVAFLVSDRARFITGAELLVDGGASASA